jgi:glycosyltransferase involved in cell wall biosynthesis
MEISLVIPVYNEAGNISDLATEISEVFINTDIVWECIWIDDASEDNTWKEIKKLEFLHDELILNCLMWKNNIKPKYFWFGLNILNVDDLKFFYNYNNADYNNRVDMNQFGKGHDYQSFIPYDKEEIVFFHCIKDSKLASDVNNYILEREVDENFEERVLSFYDDIKQSEKREIINQYLQIVDNNIDGGFLEVKADPRRNFFVKFLLWQRQKNK